MKLYTETRAFEPHDSEVGISEVIRKYQKKLLTFEHLEKKHRFEHRNSKIDFWKSATIEIVTNKNQTYL